VKLVIDLSEEEWEKAERDGTVLVQVEAAELRQGVLVEERRVIWLEVPSRQHFAQGNRITPDRDPLPEFTGRPLRLWLAPRQEEGDGRREDRRDD
jgi:hypothetical protein